MKKHKKHIPFTKKTIKCIIFFYLATFLAIDVHWKAARYSSIIGGQATGRRFCAVLMAFCATSRALLKIRLQFLPFIQQGVREQFLDLNFLELMKIKVPKYKDDILLLFDCLFTSVAEPEPVGADLKFDLDPIFLGRLRLLV